MTDFDREQDLENIQAGNGVFSDKSPDGELEAAPEFEPAEEVGVSPGDTETVGAEPLSPEEDPEVLRDRWLRAAAEVENIRKRSAREMMAARQRERLSVVQAFLPVLDNFERAMVAQGGASNEWVSGMEAIHQQMVAAIQQFGVESFDASAEIFDPRRHEAVATANLPDRPDGSIAEVLQTGYQAKDGTVLRPAKVIVVRH